MLRLGTMNGGRLGVTARIAQHIDGSFALAVAMCAGLTMAYGSTSCSALGSACANAGGSCVLGSVICAKEAASSAQDCNTNPPNPGGAFCCLEIEDGGMPSANDHGAMSVPDGSPSDAATEIDAPPCSPVLASDYDQSCMVDADCVAVGEVSSCPAFACDGCTTAGINKSAMAQYTTAFDQAFAAKEPGTGCRCPCESGAVCRGGKCQAAFCGPPTADTLPACESAGDAGGMCLYSANATCSGTGPPDACAYSDEFCCLR
jgi:hypothetical protein